MKKFIKIVLLNVAIYYSAKIIIKIIDAAAMNIALGMEAKAKGLL